LTTGYQLTITDEWNFTPSLMVKKSHVAPFSWDLNLKFSYANNLWFGLSYRQRDAFLVWLGTRVAQKFTLGYTYEYPILTFQSLTNGSHELTVGLTLGNRFHYASPRSFW